MMRRWKPVLKIVLGTFLCGCSLYGLGVIGWTMVAERNLASWIEAPSLIKDVQIDDVTRDLPAVQVHFIYEFNGETYNGNQVGFRRGVVGDIGRNYLDTYSYLTYLQETGQYVSAYINPEDPTQAVLTREGGMQVVPLHWSAAIFIGMGGVWLLIAGLRAWSAVNHNRERQKMYPGEPWKWKAEWETGIIKPEPMTGKVTPILLALCWIPISVFFIVFITPEMDLAYTVFIWVVFPLIGYLLYTWARTSVRLRAFFHHSVFKFEPPAGSIGETLTGQITLPLHLAKSEVKLNLLCLNRTTLANVITHVGIYRAYDWTVVWKYDQSVPWSEMIRDADHIEVPVEFTIPDDVPACRESDPDDQIHWRLDVTIEYAGRDFTASYLVPVFDISPSRIPDRT